MGRDWRGSADVKCGGVWSIFFLAKLQVHNLGKNPAKKKRKKEHKGKYALNALWMQRVKAELLFYCHVALLLSAVS